MLTVDLQRAGISPGTRVLDVGCGGGRHAFACAARGADVVAVDASRGELEPVAALLAAMEEAGEITAPARGAVACADLAQLPFGRASFDRIVAAEVLEHIVDDEAALGELARVLTSDGLLVVTVPRFGPELVNWALSAAYHEVEGGHVRIYRRRQLVGRLRRAGFDVIGSHHAHALHSPYWWLRCLVGVDNDHNPLVRAYHRVLVYDIVRRPRWLHGIERLLNPLVGKSLVLYCRPRATALLSSPTDLARRGEGELVAAGGDRVAP
ncbi:MAG: class I SAM-dependent methyltransferase [Actinomycetota bacterium]|nr:class I SAM-dependent methyltransferase [Actinomycetota bacterium]